MGRYNTCIFMSVTITDGRNSPSSEFDYLKNISIKFILSGASIIWPIHRRSWTAVLPRVVSTGEESWRHYIRTNTTASLCIIRICIQMKQLSQRHLVITLKQTLVCTLITKPTVNCRPCRLLEVLAIGSEAIFSFLVNWNMWTFAIYLQWIIQ